MLETVASATPFLAQVIFTGSPGVGRLVARTAAVTLTPCVLELGGKDAAILCEDADLSAALPMVLRGTFQVGAQRACLLSLEGARCCTDCAVPAHPAPQNSGQNCVGIGGAA